MINKEKLVAVCAAMIMGLGLFSCALDPTVESPGKRTVTLAEGMPPDIAVSEPRVTYDGNTTTLTYLVNVSGGPKKSFDYTAQNTVAEAASPEPLSIEALILRYGTLFSNDPAAGVAAGESYALKPEITGSGVGKASSYVIIPLDTSYIRDYLKKKLAISVDDEDDAGKGADVPLVWIEENPAIGIVETVDKNDTTNWEDGRYEDTGIRIGGFYNPTVTTTDEEIEEDIQTILYNTISTIENFDDGKDGRILSVATVLADGTDRDKKRYTSAVNFYAGDLAGTIKARVTDKDKPLKGAEAVQEWMKSNKPVLRVVYQWAD